MPGDAARRPAPADDAARRWDGASVHAWDGTYGEYLSAKVAKVFPALFTAVTDRTATRSRAGRRGDSIDTAWTGLEGRLG